MAHSIHIEGEERSFTAMPGQSLLAAALGAGVAAPYGCANGNCGDCRAVLVSGEVERVAHSDFVMPRAEREAGALLMCCNAPVADCTLRLAGGDPGIESQTLRVKVQRLTPLGDGVHHLELRTPRSRLLRYLSGQRVRLTLADGETAELALASCPCEGDRLGVHVRIDEALPLGRALARLRRGDALEIHGPMGAFTLDETGGEALAFIADGTGYAAVHSLLSQVINLDLDVPVMLFRTRPAHGVPYLDNYCRSLVDALDSFDYLLVPPDPDAVAASVAASRDALGADTTGEAVRVWIAAGDGEAAMAAALVARGFEPSAVRCYGAS